MIIYDANKNQQLDNIQMTKGRYRLTFENPFNNEINRDEKLDLSIYGKGIIIEKVRSTKNGIVVTLELVNNPVQLVVIVLGAAAALGLAGYLVLRVEKLTFSLLPIAAIAYLLIRK